MKQQRQLALLRIVRRRPVASQQALALLLKKAGVSATQASISRDLRELGLVKVDGRYCPMNRLPAAARNPAQAALHELITTVEPVGANLLVVRTPVGAAAPVAVAVDQLRSPAIAGTVAGDDTILVAVRSRSAQGQALALLKQLQSGPPRRNR
jgi:transcriptional regulator of arginine metabolism